MSIWDDISNGFSNATDATQSALSQIPSAFGTASSYLPSGSAINSGIKSIGNVLGGFGAGIQGQGTQYLQGLQERNANTDLQGLGQQLANGTIDQGQYLKSVAQYSPETYNKMITAQMQSTPAAVKTFNDIQNLKNLGLEAYKQGDMVKAKDFIDQANLLTGVSRPAYAGANMFSLPNGTEPAGNQPNAVTSGAIAPIPGSNVAPVIQPTNPQVANQVTPPNEMLNNTPGQTGAEKAVSNPMLDKNTPATAPIVSPMAQPPKSPEPQPGQTVLQQKLAQKKYEVDNEAYLSEQKASGPDTVAYDKDVTKRANVSSNMVQLITEMQDAQKNFKAGALAPAQATILKWASAFGKELSPEEVASLSSQQAFNKWTNTLVGQAAKLEGGASRLQAAYTGIVGSTPNTSLQPETLDKLFPAMLTTAAQDINEQKAWAAQKTANPSLTGGQFRRQYESEHNTTQEKAGGNLPGYAGNKASAPTGLPQGTKSNPDGTLTLPDGRIVRKKQ